MMRRFGYRELVHQLELGGLYFFTVILGERTGEKMILQNGRLHCGREELRGFWESTAKLAELEKCPYTLLYGGSSVFVEYIVPEPELVLCGGGHISLETAALAGFMEYPCTVIDDRAEFGGSGRFPGAKECICMPFGQALREKKFTAGACYIIVTRGHENDLLCLELVLGRPSAYIGMIGSRGKTAKCMDELRRKGWPEDVLKTVHAPIGIDIGGQTPKEIAVSIVAELIQVKNRAPASGSLEAGLRKLLSGGEPVVTAAITARKGSAPRGVGSRMVVGRDGRPTGSIGGGEIERLVMEEGSRLYQNGGFRLLTYRLDNASAASAGMWCGGQVQVFLEYDGLDTETPYNSKDIVS